MSFTDKASYHNLRANQTRLWERIPTEPPGQTLVELDVSSMESMLAIKLRVRELKMGRIHRGTAASKPRGRDKRNQSFGWWREVSAGGNA